MVKHSNNAAASSSKVLKRNMTPSGAIELCKMKVIKGGLLDDFMILPVVNQMKIESIKITSTQTTWLNAMLVGVKSFDPTAKAVISQVIHELRVALAKQCGGTDAGASRSNIAAPVEDMDDDQRKALTAGDSSDDDGNDSQCNAVADQTYTKKGVAGTDRWHSVAIDGVMVTIFISSNSGSLFLKADDDIITKFIQLCFNAKGLHKAMHGRSVFLPGQSSGGFVPEA